MVDTNTKFLFAAWPDDAHACAVAQVLRARGRKVDFFRSADYPMKSLISNYVSSKDGVRVEIDSPDGTLSDHHYSVVWWRRYAGFHPTQELHPEDKWIVEIENRVYSRHFPHLLAPNARWINSPHGEVDGTNKPLQLRLAIEMGLDVPETMVTNSRTRAEAFIRSAAEQGQEVVFKTLNPHHWISQESDEKWHGAISYTREIVTGDLADESIFRVFAGMFQHKCNSVYEVRAVFMGCSYVAISYNRRGSPGRQLDARCGPLTPGVAERHTLPEEVREKCQALMARLGLSFGCVDMLVNDDGKYVFLEVNPEGQWLWMEYVCPEIKLLTPFCEFLETGGVSEHEFIRNSDDVVYQSIQPIVERSLR